MAADLSNMQLISKCNKGFRFLLCVFDTFSKYAWVIPLKGKKGIIITTDFHKKVKKVIIITTESNRKPNKTWVDEDSEFHNRSMKSFF